MKNLKIAILLLVVLLVSTTNLLAIERTLVKFEDGEIRVYSARLENSQQKTGDLKYLTEETANEILQNYERGDKIGKYGNYLFKGQSVGIYFNLNKTFIVLFYGILIFTWSLLVAYLYLLNKTISILTEIQGLFIISLGLFLFETVMIIDMLVFFVFIKGFVSVFAIQFIVKPD
ncbi:hypothetical protein ACFLY7_00745 [Patescibacteria group bacterium]